MCSRRRRRDARRSEGDLRRMGPGERAGGQGHGLDHGVRSRDVWRWSGNAPDPTAAGAAAPHARAGEGGVHAPSRQGGARLEMRAVLVQAPWRFPSSVAPESMRGAPTSPISWWRRRPARRAGSAAGHVSGWLGGWRGGWCDVHAQAGAPLIDRFSVGRFARGLPPVTRGNGLARGQGQGGRGGGRNAPAWELVVLS